MAAYAIDALAFCRSMLGHPYLAGGCRCEVTCYTQDCSGLIVAASRFAGLPMPCINSAGFAVWGREAGTLISEQEAIHTPFALGIRGPNGGEGGNGPLGHIVPFVGDGAHTYEAMGTRYGICIGRATGRGFSRWMKVPGLIYGPKPTPFQPERRMLLQTHHYDANGKAVKIPERFPTGHPREGQMILPTIGANVDGTKLLLSDGASFVGAGKPNYGDDVYMPPEVAAHGPIIGIAGFTLTDGRRALIVRFKDGHQISRRLT